MSEWFKPRVPLIFNNESISPYGLNEDNGFLKSFVKQFSKKEGD